MFYDHETFPNGVPSPHHHDALTGVDKNGKILGRISVLEGGAYTGLALPQHTMQVPCWVCFTILKTTSLTPTVM